MFIKRAPLTRALASSFLLVALSACSSSDDDSLTDGINDVTSEADADTGADADTDADAETDAGANADAEGDQVAAATTCEAANAAETLSAADAPYFAFANTRSTGFDAGFYERLSIGENVELSGCSEPNASSDNFAVTDGTHLYGIGRFNQDNVTRYNIETFEADYQYSVVGDDGVASNPHDMAFVDETKAYVARYGTGEVWIVNPSATSQEEFFVGTIDLSAYDADGATEMTRAVVVGDRLFVLMQRLQQFSPTQNGYIAVIDTNTDTEIATGQGADGLNGIELPMRNGLDMFFNDATNDLVVSSAGDFFNPDGANADTLTGGVALVDATDFSVEVLIDDDTLGEFVDSVAIASADKGYVVTTTSFGTAFLRAFNPTTGVVETDPLSNFSGIDITAIGVGPMGNVWIGINDDAAPGFDRINPADDSPVGGRIRTELIPESLVFIAR